MISKIQNFKSATKLCFGNQYKRFYILMFVLLINGILEGLSLATIPLLLVALFKVDQIDYFSNLSLLNFDLSGINPIVLIGIIVITIFIIKNLFLFFVICFENYTYLELKKKISSKVFYGMITKDFISYSQRSNAKAIRLLSNDIYGAVEYYRAILLVIREALTLMAILTLLFFTSSFFGISAFFVLGLFAYIFFKSVQKIITKNAKTILYFRTKIIEKVQNSLRGLKEIKVFSLEKIIFKNFTNDFISVEKKSLVNDIIFRAPRIFMEVLAIIFLVSSLIFLSFKLSVAELVPILTLLAAAVVRFVPSYTSLTSNLSKFKSMIPSYENILNEISNNQNNTISREEVDDYKNDFSELNLKNIDFSYEESKKILTNVSLNLKKNCTYFIKGKSGKGKSTLCYLILGLLKPNKGKILIDNNILYRDKTKKLFSYVPQECLIINDTITKNIVFDQNIDDNDYLQTIFKEIGINDFIEIHKDNLLGDGGDLLSGGQKQRIAIARSLIRRPKILILDESFNALHEEAEMTLIKNIKKLCPEITLLIISHRNTVTKYADEIIDVLDDGSVIVSKSIKT